MPVNYASKSGRLKFLHRAMLQVAKEMSGPQTAADASSASRFESEPVERDKPRAIKPRPEVSPRKDKRDGNAPHPTP